MRLFASFAAFFLVFAFAQALLFSPEMSLTELFARIDHDAPVALQRWVTTRGAGWLWTYVIAPVLGRPCWMIPVSLGLMMVGATVTAASRRGGPAVPPRRL